VLETSSLRPRVTATVGCLNGAGGQGAVAVQVLIQEEALYPLAKSPVVLVWQTIDTDQRQHRKAFNVLISSPNSGLR